MILTSLKDLLIGWRSPQKTSPTSTSTQPSEQQLNTNEPEMPELQLMMAHGVLHRAMGSINLLATNPPHDSLQKPLRDVLDAVTEIALWGDSDEATEALQDAVDTFIRVRELYREVASPTQFDPNQQTEGFSRDY